MPMIEAANTGRQSPICRCIADARDKGSISNGITFSTFHTTADRRNLTRYIMWVSLETDLADIDELYHELNRAKLSVVEVVLVPDAWLWTPKDFVLPNFIEELSDAA